MIPQHYLNSVVTGDARELANAIPDESIDLIFTDPPYLKQFIPLYGWLAETGYRILKPGGYLYAYGAGEHMPEYLACMTNKGLDYFWTFALLHNGGYPRIWYKQLMSGYKPVFVFTKGKPNKLAWQATVCTDSADKRFHEWGQGAGMTVKTLELLTSPGDLILDPFCGGGTTPAACKITNRNYIAFEIDPDTAAKARGRIANTQPPLFTLAPQQTRLDID